VSPELSRIFAGEKMAAVRKEEDPAEKKKQGRMASTVADLCDKFLKEYSKPHNKPRTYQGNERLIEKHIKPKIGSLKVEAVTKADILKLHHEMKNTPYEANHVRAVISKMFNLAESWGLRKEGTNPARHIKKYQETKRERFLDTDELQRLGNSLKEIGQEDAEYAPALAAIRLLLLTGCRVSEMLSLEWGWIDLNNNRIRLPDSKTGAKTVYLSAEALQIFKELEQESDKNCSFVFPAVRNSKKHLTRFTLDKIWARIRLKASLKNVRLHDLRHTFASWAVMTGYGLPLTGALLGHSAVATTQRYAHLGNDPLKQAANDIGGNLHKMLTGFKKPA